jgi:hypothetical protein
LSPAFENSIETKKSDPNFVKFGKIRPNFDWRRFCTVKKSENQKLTEFTRLIRSNWSKFGLIHPKFSGIVDVIEFEKKLNFNYINIRNLE